MAAGCAALGLAAVICIGAARYNHRMDTVVADVGQGQCVLLKSGVDFALVDCGSSNRWYDAGDTAADWLRTMGCRKLKWLVLTHYDSDHINGVERLLTRLPAETLLVPEIAEDPQAQQEIRALAQAHGMKTAYVTEVRELPFGDAVLTLFPPLGDSGSNEKGLAILASAGERRMLITGDMNRATERRLVETYALPEITVLLAGHHGARDAVSDTLLDAVRPETAVISVGSNSYGHPSEETLQRLARAGCAVYRTDRHGSVTISWN